jgi:DNA-binding CsgD family transcriptional regulator
MQRPTRVFIVAEDEQQSRNLRRIFEKSADFAITGFTRSPTAEAAEPENLDVRIIQTKHFSQFARFPACVPTLYLLSESSPQVKELTGPSAALPADASPLQIRAAAIALAAGLQVAVRSSPPAENAADFTFVEPLTDRELHVLNLLADGLSNPQIGRLLQISRNTVKFHVSSIISKLGATSRTEAVTIGVKRGLIIL